MKAGDKVIVIAKYHPMCGKIGIIEKIISSDVPILLAKKGDFDGRGEPNRWYCEYELERV